MCFSLKNAWAVKQLEGGRLVRGSMRFSGSHLPQRRTNVPDPGAHGRESGLGDAPRSTVCWETCQSENTGYWAANPVERGSCALEITVAGLIVTKANQGSPKVMAACKPGHMTAGRIQSLAAVRRRSWFLVVSRRPCPWFPVP